MAVGTILIVKFPEYWGFYIWGSVALAVTIITTRRLIYRILILITAATLYLRFYNTHEVFLISLTGLVPTIIHVFVFTFLFILSGFLKRLNRFDLLTLTFIVVATVSFFIVPAKLSVFFPDWTEHNIGILTKMTTAMATVLGLESNELTLTSFSKFVAFAYTFHYLNWFSKTRFIGWHRTSGFRIGLMAVGYISFVGIYLYDYQVGFKALLFLSLLHVVLELPLNIITVREIFGMKFYRLAPSNHRSKNVRSSLSEPEFS